MKTRQTPELRILKALLWIYIIFCIVIAGLNYGYAPKATPSAAAFISALWHFYENWIKTLFIIAGSILSLRLVKQSKQSRMFKNNVRGFTIAALLIHIILPFFTANQEIYFFSMPLPWTTSPLQLFYEESSLYVSRFPVWGLGGISWALIIYGIWSIVVIVGTLFMGRRWQCSTICLFNGFASEVFYPAFPLLGKKKKVSPGALKIFSLFRILFFLLAVFFTTAWLLFLFNRSVDFNMKLLSEIEVYKYLSFELMLMMFLWIAFTGRGYCYYCPLGTSLAFLSMLCAQQIRTDCTHCIGCGRCDKACPMGIEIMQSAKEGKPVKELRCVGCGHCVDSCPTDNLAYSTKFLESLK